MWNIALFVRAFVFHIAFVFRNILFKWNIGSRPISGMFRLFHVFRFSRGRGQIPRPGIFEARTPVSSKGVITLAQLLGLHAVRLEQAGQPPRVKRLAAERAPRGLFHHVQGFEQLARGESVTTLIIKHAPNIAEESDPNDSASSRSSPVSSPTAALRDLSGYSPPTSSAMARSGSMMSWARSSSSSGRSGSAVDRLSR